MNVIISDSCKKITHTPLSPLFLIKILIFSSFIPNIFSSSRMCKARANVITHMCDAHVRNYFYDNGRTKWSAGSLEWYYFGRYVKSHINDSDKTSKTLDSTRNLYLLTDQRYVSPFLMLWCWKPVFVHGKVHTIIIGHIRQGSFHDHMSEIVRLFLSVSEASLYKTMFSSLTQRLVILIWNILQYRFQKFGSNKKIYLWKSK